MTAAQETVVSLLMDHVLESSGHLTRGIFQNQVPACLFSTLLNIYYASADVHASLLGCVNRVKLRRCEAAYLGSLVDKDRFCPTQSPKEGKTRTGVGSLVLHVRSGDIFDSKGVGRHNPGFGQVGTINLVSAGVTESRLRSVE